MKRNVLAWDSFKLLLQTIANIIKKNGKHAHTHKN